MNTKELVIFVCVEIYFTFGDSLANKLVLIEFQPVVFFINQFIELKRRLIVLTLILRE